MTTDAVKQPRGLMALANPTRFLAFVQIVLPYLSLTALALLAVGLWMAFSVPDDYQQGRNRAHHVCPCSFGLDGECRPIW